MSNKAIFCIAGSRTHAERLIDLLRNANFSNHNISLLLANKSATVDPTHEKKPKATESAASGPATGGALSWIAKIGALAIPNVGPFIAAGPLMTALSGPGTGAETKTIIAGLLGFGVPETEANRYEGKVKAGHILVAVHAENSAEIARARDLFSKFGGQDFCVADEASATRGTQGAHRGPNPPAQVPSPA